MHRLTSTWDRVFGKLRSKRTSKKRKGLSPLKRRSFALEPLEERTLLSVCTWDGGGANDYWGTAANWLNDTAPVAGDELVFAGTVRTSTINNYMDDTEFRTITINDDDFTLSGNRIELTGDLSNRCITLDSAENPPDPDTAIDATIALDIDFVNNGSIITAKTDDTLTISGDVSFPNLQLLVQGVSGDGADKVIFEGAVDGRDFRVNEYGTATFTGSSSLTTTAFTLAGSGTSGTINWESSGTLNPGALYVSFAGADGTFTQISGTVSVANGLRFSGNKGTCNLTYPGILTTNSVIVVSTEESEINFAGGILRASNNLTLGEDLVIKGDSDFVYFNTNGHSIIVNGDLSGSGAFYKMGTGTLTLNGTGTRTGETRIGNGTLELGNSLALQSSTLNMYSADSGSISFGSLTSVTLGGLMGSRPLALVNASSSAVALTVGYGSAADRTYSGILSGTGGSLTKIGTGTLTLSDANTFTGGTSIDAGTLNLSGGNNRLYTSGDVTLGGGTLDLGGYGQTLSSATAVAFEDSDGSLIENGTLTLIGSGATITASNSATITANITVTTNDQNWTVATDEILYIGGTVTFTNRLLYIEGDGETVFNGVGKSHSGGSLRVREDGEATFTAGDLTAGSVYVGFVSDGTLNWQSSGTLTGQYVLSTGWGGGSGTITQTQGLAVASPYAAWGLQFGCNDSTYNLNGGTLSVNNVGSGAYTGCSLNFAGGILQATGDLSFASNISFALARYSFSYINTNAHNISVAGVISGSGQQLWDSGHLTKQGAGTLTLSGANTFTGYTWIEAGTLALANSLALQCSTLDLDSGDSGSLSFGTLTSATFGGLSGSRDLSLQNASSSDVALTIDSADNSGYSGELSGTGSLTKIGIGSFGLCGANTYSGSTTINAGVLQVCNASAIPSGTDKGNVTVNGTLNLNGYSITINGLSGSGKISSGLSGDVTLTVGGNNQTSSFSGLIEDGAGAVALSKIGTGTVTLAETQTYTGDTTVTAGTLNVLGNLNSHVTVTGGAVTGLIFYDPHVAAAVRETLGLDPDAILDEYDVAELTSLYVDSNLVSNLKGLEHADNLESLTLMPGDYSGDLETLSDLSPLKNLDNLETLALQHCGLDDTALATLSSDSIQPDALESLDVRYNVLEVVPEEISDYLPSLTSLYVYGNSEITDDPITGLDNLAGKLVNVDIEPSNPEEATTIADLADALYNLPIEMYEYVLNTIEYQPYAGAMKGALAVLQTGFGNDWDTASLLVGLFSEAGISVSYVSGTITVPVEKAMTYLGVLDEDRAEEVLDDAGLDASISGDNITFDHTWLQSSIGGTTYKFDPSWKFRDFQEGLGNMLEDVSFNDASNGDYLSEIRVETAAEYYAQAVREYLADPANGLTDMTIADVAYDGPILQQVVTSLPTELPYTTGFSSFTVVGAYDSQSGQTTLTASADVFSEDMESTTWVFIEIDSVTDDYAVVDYISPTQVKVAGNADTSAQNAPCFLQSTIIPEASTHQVEVELESGNESFDWSDMLPDICLSRLTIDPNVSGNYAQPKLLLDGVQVAICSGQISKDATTTITITHYYGASEVVPPSEYSRYADDYIAIGLNAHQTSERMLVDAWTVVNDAQVSKANNGSPTDDALIGSLLFLDAMTYYHEFNESGELVAGLTGAVPVYNFISSCLVTSTTELQATPDMDQQVPYLPEWMVIDVQNGNPYPQVSITSSDTYRVMRYNLLGYTSSALESAVWEELTNIPSFSTIKSLQYANENTITIAEFDVDDELDDIKTALNAIDNSSPIFLRDNIAEYIDDWVQQTGGGDVYKVEVPTDETPMGDGPQWNGVGLICTFNDYAVGYIIIGYVSGGIQYGVVQGGWAGGSQNVVVVTDSSENSTCVAEPIDVANGNVVHEATDFSIPNLGAPLEFSRKYDSFNADPAGDTDRGMGEGWSFTYSDRLEFNPDNSITWFNDKGIYFTFESDGQGGYITPDTIFGELEFDDIEDEYTWTDSHENTATFDDDGRLLQMLDHYGNGVDLTYDGASTRIYQVKDHVTPARCLTFTYTSDLITSIADFSSRTWTYGYTSGLLTSVTTPSNQQTPQEVTEYAYYTDTTRAGLLQTITYPDDSEVDFTYYANRRGFQVTDSEGNVDTLLYNLYNLGESEDTNFGRTTYIDRRGSASRYTYDENGYVTELQYPDWTTEAFEWTDGLLTAADDAFGQAEDYQYDANGNLTEYTDRAGYVVDYTYTTDGFNNVDTITYTNDLDGESYNADLVIDFTYDGSGRLTDRTDSDGVLDYHTVYTYVGAAGTRGLPDSITTPKGYLTPGDSNDYKTTFTYNSAGQILAATYRVSPTNSIVESYTYDSLGNLLTTTDGESNVTTYTYDLLDRLLTATYPDPDGAGDLPAPHETYEYNSAGNLESVTVDTSGVDPLTTTITYDEMWRETRIEYADGTYITYGYDQGGNLVHETDELGRVARYVYDSRGRLIATIFPRPLGEGQGEGAAITRIAYNGGGRVVATTDALDNTTEYEYDLLGRLTTVTDAEDGETEYAYDAAGNLATVTDALDNVTSYDYDNLGQLIEVTEPDPDGGGAQTSPVTEYEYDANGNLISVTDPRDYETTYDYDEADRLIAVNLPDPDGGGPLGILTTEYEYDDAGNLVTVTDPLDNETTYEYDALGRLITVTEPDPDGGGAQTSPVTEYEYDAYGDLVAATDPLDNTTTYQYNTIGQLTAVTDALGNTTSYLYDAAGNLLWTTEPLTDDDVLSAYALGATTKYEYDSMNRLVLATDAEAGETAYTYDDAGRLLTLTDPEENTTTWVYDSLGRVTEETNELEDTRYYVYNDAGLLVRAIDREDRVIVYEYDNLYRNTTEIWYNNVTDANADQNRQNTITYTYDAVGNLLTASDPTASYAYDYDGLGRVYEETQTIAGLTPVIVFSSQYNANGRRTQLSATISASDDFVNAYTYDNLNRLTQLTQDDQAGNAVAEKRIDFTYDAASRYATIARYANLAGTQEVATGTYTFDPLGRLTNLVYTQPNSTGLPYYGWQYDAAGRMTWMETIDGEVDYAHDDTNQLTDADYDYQSDEDYTYDENGNRTIAGYVTGPNNQLLSDGTYRYLYDDEGDREFRYVDADSSGTLNTGDTDVTEYEWDHRNRLTEVEHFTTYANYDAGTSDQIVEYSYDCFNRLITRMLDPDGTSGATAVEQSIYAYDSLEIVAQFDKTGSGDLAATDLSHRYLWNPQAIDQLFADEQVHYDGGFVTDELLWTLTDHLNSVRDLATYNSGTDVTTVATHRVFDAFGNETSSTGSAECLFGYTGKLFDDATQSQYNWQRWYDALVGRWLSQDQIWDGTNLYAYVGNNSATNVDPLGLVSAGIQPTFRPQGFWDRIFGVPPALGDYGNANFYIEGKPFRIGTAPVVPSLGGHGPSYGDITLSPIYGGGTITLQQLRRAAELSETYPQECKETDEQYIKRLINMARNDEGKTKIELQDEVSRLPKPPPPPASIGPTPPEPMVGSHEWAERILAQWRLDESRLPEDRTYHISSEELRLAVAVLGNYNWWERLLDGLLSPVYGNNGSQLDDAIGVLGTLPTSPKPLPPPVDRPHSR